jgi:hypothetical protein
VTCECSLHDPVVLDKAEANLIEFQVSLMEDSGVSAEKAD